MEPLKGRDVRSAAWVIGVVLGLAAVGAEGDPLRLEPYLFETSAGETVDAELGTLTVPLDHSDPESGTIDLKFVRFAGEGDGAPIVYLAGGPGGSGIGAARSERFELFMRLRESGDVIAFDQRGTGLSEPRWNWSASFDTPVAGRIETAWLEEQFAKAAASGRAELAASGRNPDCLNTAQSAADLEALRMALGADKLRLLGISYGTHLALATMKLHPDAVESAVLAGVENLDSTTKLPSQVDEPIALLSAYVAADPKIGARVPDFEGLLRRMFERAERAPFAVGTVDPSSGETVTAEIGRFELEMLAWELLKSRETIGMLPGLLLALDAGATQPLQMVVRAFRGKGKGRMGRPMQVAMDCASGADRGRLDRIRAEAPTALFELAPNALYDWICPSFGTTDLGSVYREPLRTEIPVLCFSGELDVRTPPSNAERLLRTLSRGEHVLITSAAHDNDLLIASPKIAENMIAFFQGRAVPHGTIELPPIEFSLGR